jgi:hypothetical protein
MASGIITSAPWKTQTRPIPNRSAKSPLLWMFLVGLALRLVAVAFFYQLQMPPARDHWVFGWETAKIAASIASSHGFSSPLHGFTGSTAWIPPLYPYLLAGIFKLLGIYSTSSAVAVLVVNSVFSAVTVIPLYRAACYLTDRQVAIVAGYIWALFPYAIYFSAHRIWSHTLAALLMTLMVAQGLRVLGSRRVVDWTVLGLVAGLNALTNPTALAVLPVILIWAYMRSEGERRRFVLLSVATMLTLLAVCMPWTIRNYFVFGRFIPIRSNFWIEMRVGNTGDTSDIVPDWAHPANGDAEMQEYKAVGEIAYADHKRQQTLAFITHYPALYAWLTVRRITYFWTGIWSFDREFRRREPLQFANAFLCTALLAFSVVGLKQMWSTARSHAGFLLAILAVYPIVYYLSHPLTDYRHPIDALLVLLSAAACVNFLRRNELRALTRHALPAETPSWQPIAHDELPAK